MKKIVFTWLLYLFIIRTGTNCDQKLRNGQNSSSLSSLLQSSSSCSNYTDGYRCDTGKCIANKYICDGNRNCDDGSDEKIDLCNTIRIKDIEMKTHSRKKRNDIISVHYDKGTSIKTQLSNNIKTVCGKISPSFNGKNSPWNMLIFYIEEFKFTGASTLIPICEGTLISEDIVITAARCFYDDDEMIRGGENMMKNYVIVSGEYLNDMKNHVNQILRVKSIQVHDNYNGVNSLYKNDIAAIGLSAKVQISNIVLPACIDWDRKYLMSEGLLGKITLYNKKKVQTLYELLVAYVTRNSCKQNYKANSDKVTDDKFCADDSQTDPAISLISRGSGLIYEHDNIYYITGIRSYENIDGNDLITAYTEIRYHINWIHKQISYINQINTKCNEADIDQCPLELLVIPNFKPTIMESLPDDPIQDITTTTNKQNLLTNERSKCVIPYTEGSIYSIKNKKQILSPGSLVNQNQIVNEDCKPGYFKVDNYRYMICKENGQWDPYIPDKLCLKMCPALISDNLQFKCTHNGEPVDCSRPMNNGTRAIPNCRVTHHLANGEPYPPILLSCLPDGKWDRLYLPCVPFCGKVFSSHHVKPLIAGGVNATHGTAPWNIGIYEKSQSSYELICGGSLISENMVISAAHCFKSVISSTETVTIADEKYKIGVGKYNRDISVKDSMFTQIINAKQIYIREYYGLSGYYFNDIVIVVLQTKIVLSGIVLPICIHWKNNPTIPNGSLGKVVGWGRTENLKQSPVLLESYLPYIDHNTCLNINRIEFRNFVTPDKFCAGSKSGPGVDEGDSGAGLTYGHNGLYYLTGIVSIKNTQANDSIALFTDIFYHISWINDIYIKHTNIISF